jgi:hypothetical protein
MPGISGTPLTRLAAPLKKSTCTTFFLVSNTGILDWGISVDAQLAFFAI